MKALFFDGTLSLRDVPEPIPTADEALVKVSAAGICNTDLEITQGYMEFRGIPGHEFVGIVEHSADRQQVGKRVVGEINAGCGQCTFCRMGLQRHCPFRTVLGIRSRNGAFAEYLTLPAENLLVVPDDIADESAVFTEPFAAALEILEQVKVRPSHRVLVIGDGKLGLLVCMVLRLAGCDLLLVGKHPDKMRLFDPTGGSFMTLDTLASVDESFDIVVEASGHPSGWGLAVSRVKPRGTIVLKSTYHGGFSFNPAPLVINEINLVGSRCGLFAPAIRLMQRGLIDPSRLIDQILPFQQAEEAFSLAGKQGRLKIIMKM